MIREILAQLPTSTKKPKVMAIVIGMRVIAIVIDFPELTGNSNRSVSNSNSNRLRQDLKQ